MLSDDSSSDSDTGIRFKTDSTRRPNVNSDVDLLKNDRGRNDRKFNDRPKESYNRNDRHSYKPRDRSPIRDDWRDRNRSDDRHKSKINYSGREKSSRENGGSDKYTSSSSKLREDDKYDRRSEKFDRSFKVNRYEDESRTERSSHNNSKDRLNIKDKVSSRNNNEVVSNIRNAINRHLQPTKSDKREDRVKEFSNSRDSGVLNDNKEKLRTKANKDDEVSDKRNQTKDINKEPYITKICLSDESKSPDRISDTEMKPVSYYNMTASITPVDGKSSDSSLDEDELKKKVLSLRQKLKNTKEKKKSKHKDKKKHKKSKSKSESCTSSNSYNLEELEQQQLLLKTATNNKKRKQCEESNEEGEIISDSDESIDEKSDQDMKKLEMPDLREKLKARAQDVTIVGPLLPPRMEKAEGDNPEICEVEGPALPPHLMKSKNHRQKHVGPEISDNHRKMLEEKVGDVDELSDNEDDIEIIGPLPEGCEEKWSNAHKHLEERALKLKIDSIDGSKSGDTKIDSREEWMLKLPEGKIANLGLMSRQFRAKAGPDLSDRSSWTDTPEQKALKAAGIAVNDEETDRKKLVQNAELDYIKRRDEEQEAEVKKHKKKSKRDTSLLEIHQKKLKKKKKKSEDKDKVTRRPFDRDIDLKANRFDEAQKKAILKKAQLLDSRFSSGESKFL